MKKSHYFHYFNNFFIFLTNIKRKNNLCKKPAEKKQLDSRSTNCNANTLSCIEWFGGVIRSQKKNMNQTLAIILSFILPFFMTALGASFVFFFRKSSKTVNMITVGLASGIMLSASIWSLLIPALENAKQNWNNLAFLPVCFGFAIGGLFMIALDLISSKLFKPQTEKGKTKAFKLFTAITIHNIPEGLSVGFAVGTAVVSQSSYFIAVMFALGIALQNLPEGLATALPMYNCLGSKRKAFWFGTLSGIVEPLFATIGFFLAASISSLLPWLLSFSAGAMIFVIVKELIPEIHTDEKLSFGIWSFMIGFLIMMLLDICL